MASARITHTWEDGSLTDLEVDSGDDSALWWVRVSEPPRVRRAWLSQPASRDAVREAQACT